MELGKECVLYDGKECDGCMECEVCDLDPSKPCTNCGKCLDIKDFVSIGIDAVVEDESMIPAALRDRKH